MQNWLQTPAPPPSTQLPQPPQRSAEGTPPPPAAVAPVAADDPLPHLDLDLAGLARQYCISRPLLDTLFADFALRDAPGTQVSLYAHDSQGSRRFLKSLALQDITQHAQGLVLVLPEPACYLSLQLNNGRQSSAEIRL